MSEGTAFAEVDGLVLALLDGLVSLAERALRPAAETAAPMVDVRLEGRPGDRVACPGAARRSRPPAAGPEGGPPTVAVERTPANDVYLVLSGLGLAREAERTLADPVAFLRDHRAEARLVARWLEGRVGATESPVHTEPAPPPRPGRRRPTPAEDLRRAPSLLR